jgi:phage terminase large subunit-like protein
MLDDTQRQDARLFIQACEAERARRQLPYFIPWATPGYRRPPHMPELCQAFQDGLTHPQRVLFSAPPQFGKAASDDTPILTKRGWLTVGDVVVGDELVASDGGWTRVLQVFPQGEVQLYRVTFTSGKSGMAQVSLEVCAEHLWEVSRARSSWCVMSTQDILRNGLKHHLDGRSQFRIPVVKPWVGTSTKDLPIDPYLLGLWLGDGSKSTGAYATMDRELIDAFSSRYRTKLKRVVGQTRSYYIYGLVDDLRKLDLVVKPGEPSKKHVPGAYLYGDVSTRLSVLQGLCDTDGSVSTHGAQCFSNTNPQLIADFKWLVSSLGGTWSDSGWYTPKIIGRPQAICKDAMDVFFRLPDGLCGFRLPRKRDRVPACSTKNMPQRFINSIEPSRRGTSTCFLVDSSDHLFCAGRDLVVTHNTILLLNGLLWHAWRAPGTVSAYITYGTEPTRARATEARQVLQRLTFLKAQSNTERIRFENGSQILFTSTDGPLESHAITGWLCVDDPYKNPAEAASSVDRKRIEEWFFGTALGRIHARTNVMVVHHRWTTEDLIEKLHRHIDERTGKPVWSYKNYPALGSDDESLWEEFKSAEFLKQQRAVTLKSVWSAYYQGDPQPAGGRLFHGVNYYLKPPTSNYQVGIGIDCSYGTKTGGDWNSIVVLARQKSTYYVLEVVRSHEPSPAFEQRLARVLARWPGAPCRWYPGSSELGLAQQLAQRHKVQIPTATKNKKLRAEQCAAAWSADETIKPPKLGQILVPRDALWLDDFIQEILDFTGVPGSDLRDDQVDALAAAFDTLANPVQARVIGLPGALNPGAWGNLVTNLR